MILQSKIHYKKLEYEGIQEQFLNDILDSLLRNPNILNGKLSSMQTLMISRKLRHILENDLIIEKHTKTGVKPVILENFSQEIPIGFTRLSIENHRFLDKLAKFLLNSGGTTVYVPRKKDSY